LGSQWLAVIPLVRPLVFAGIIQSISNQSYALFLARKQYKILNIHLFSSLILMIGLIIWWGQTNQLLGAVYGILVSRLLTLPIVLIGIFNQQNEK
jgi:O-antigen/teichoic acid export membrane protein